MIIVGAGPAGIACALSLIRTKLSVLIVEKELFPRDKICGDALSADVINQIRTFFPEIYPEFIKLRSAAPSYGIKFSSPNDDSLEIGFSKHMDAAPGYICKRIDFDNFLFQKLTDLAPDRFTIQEGFKIDEITHTDDFVSIKGEGETYTAKIIVGCDGMKSLVKKTFQGSTIEKKHYCAGIRAYMKGVDNISNGNFIELHFISDVLPGYFWIFPLPDNTANVGLGLLSNEISERKLNLKEIFNEIINFHPEISQRFKNAEMIDNIKGFGLPLGSKKRKLSGHRYLLTGDAAGLIDPFTGEGIGNALRSGRFAADHIQKCFVKNDFSGKFNLEYDQYVYQKMWRELRISRGIQKLLNYPFLFNYVIKKAQKNPSLKKLLTSMLDDVDIKEELLSIKFYVKLLFNKY